MLTAHFLWVLPLLVALLLHTVVALPAIDIEQRAMIIRDRELTSRSLGDVTIERRWIIWYEQDCYFENTCSTYRDHGGGSFENYGDSHAEGNIRTTEMSPKRVEEWGNCQKMERESKDAIPYCVWLDSQLKAQGINPHKPFHVLSYVDDTEGNGGNSKQSGGTTSGSSSNAHSNSSANSSSNGNSGTSSSSSNSNAHSGSDAHSSGTGKPGNSTSHLDIQHKPSTESPVKKPSTNEKPVVKQDSTPKTDSKPVTDKPKSESKLASDKPVSDKSASDKTASDKPVSDKTASDKTASDKPVSDKPVSKPVSNPALHAGQIVNDPFGGT